MAGIVDGFKRFLSGAAEFLGATPKYLDDSVKTISKNFDELYKKNPVALLEKYSPDTLIEVDGKKALPENFSKAKLDATGARNAYIKETKEAVRRTNAFNALDYDNFDPGSQVGLEKVYRTMTGPKTGEKFKKEYFQHQLDLGKKGMFGDKFGNFFNSGEPLNEKQLGVLSEYFDTEYGNRIANFEKKYLQTGVEDVAGPPQRLNYNLGLQKRYLNTDKGTRQLQMIHGMSGKKGESIIDAAIKKDSNNATTLNAYKEYINKNLVETPDINGSRWQAPKGFTDWATEQGIEDSEIKRISKELASGDPDHSGINIWQKAKDHPVIATSLVMGTAWGISELTENDSF